VAIPRWLTRVIAEDPHPEPGLPPRDRERPDPNANRPKETN
jgi:hypothetical protein